MMIDLQIRGTFSYFRSRSLTLDEQARWDEYPVVFLTPDSDRWNPHATHYAEAEASMLDSGGNIDSRERNRTTIFDEADISVMYA